MDLCQTVEQPPLLAKSRKHAIKIWKVPLFPTVDFFSCSFTLWHWAMYRSSTMLGWQKYAKVMSIHVHLDAQQEATSPSSLPNSLDLKCILCPSFAKSRGAITLVIASLTYASALSGGLSEGVEAQAPEKLFEWLLMTACLLPIRFDKLVWLVAVVDGDCGIPDAPWNSLRKLNLGICCVSGFSRCQCQHWKHFKRTPL